MNEELQSMNDELHISNSALRERQDEVDRLNTFMTSVLGSMKAGLVVVDSGLRILAWNAKSEDLWAIRADEAHGQHLFGLDIGLPLDGVRGALRRVLGGTDERVDVELEALNRRGRSMMVKVTLLALGATPEVVSGAILLTAPVDGRDGSGDGAA